MIVAQPGGCNAAVDCTTRGLTIREEDGSGHPRTRSIGHNRPHGIAALSSRSIFEHVRCAAGRSRAQVCAFVAPPRSGPRTGCPNYCNAASLAQPAGVASLVNRRIEPQ